MSKKLLDLLPTFQTFQDNVISQLTNMFNGAEWLNDTTSYTKQETIYKLLMLKYGDRYIRYDDENIFLNRLVFDLADFLPDIYAKQQVFIKNKLNEFLSDNKNRAVIIDSTSSNSRNTDNNTKFGNSSSPLNLVISNANEITNAPITSLNLSNVKLLENYNGNNEQVNYNFVNDLIKTLNSDYSLRLNEFMELLGKHFISVVGSYYRNQNDIQTVKDEPYRFNNGYLVNEVDYLCTDNKQEINRFNEKLGRLSDQVATKQNQLTAGSNISINNNVISANVPQTDLSNYYTKQEIDAREQQQNTNISNNTTEIARVDRVVATNSTNIVNLDNKVNTNTSNISTNTNNITTNTNNINRLDNEVVKLSGAQNISGVKTITASGGEALKFNSGTDNSAYISGYKSNNQRIWYFGKGSSTSNNFVIGADRSDIKLEPSGKVDLSNKKIGWLADPTADQDAANKRYVDNLNNQNVKLAGDQSIGGNKTFTQSISVPTPTTGTNAATKQYVDDAITNNRVDTSNFATLNTTQTITGAKTFNNNVVISKNPTPLILKANNNDKTYMLIKSSDDTTNFSLGANSSNTSLEVNRGDLTIQTQQANKNVNFVNAARIKFNRSVLEMGTEINAGFGGGSVKFIPEDNSTKTLQFYNANPSDTRRFKLLVPEPTEAQNPATKNYVDTTISSLQTNSDLGLNLRYQDIIVPTSPSKFEEGNTIKYWFTNISLPETKLLGAVVNYQGQSNAASIQKYWNFSYSVASGSKIYFQFTTDKLTNYQNNTPNWSQTKIRIFYINSL